MRKFTLLLSLFCGFCTFSYADRPPLDGFRYGLEAAPVGNEWENPESLALNKEQPRSWFFSFQDAAHARKVLPENSLYWKSLDGDWKFHWAPDPDARPKDFYRTDFDASSWDVIPVPSNWNIYGIQKDGSLKYGVPVYVNQPVIFWHQVKVDDWRGGVMRTPPTDWTTYRHRNEVGSYLREFELPADWEGREVFISFDGVDSFFYLWINGHYVGFSKNSRNTARFDISPFLQEGKNTVAVEVYRSSDGSFLEAQDMFRLPGIFRTVALTAVPKVHIRDLVVTPDLDRTYTDGSLHIRADVRNLGKKTAKGYSIAYSLYRNSLYGADNVPVENALATSAVTGVAAGHEEAAGEAVMQVEGPALWSAECPHCYVLVAELKDRKGRTVETVSTTVGFRKVEIRDTPAEEDEFGLAGRYYYVNGRTVKLKGVNRHETNPAVGHAITREMMEKEIMLMKRANINHVRNSHYTDDPYWYYLCNRYGIYLEDEANIESHEYYYGEASLSHPKEWEDAHVGRVMEMVHSNVNNPSIVIWSLGNEAGPGQNFVTAYRALKSFDLSRPVQYERNNDIVDMGSNQYPSIAWVRNAVQGKYDIKYPFHISEYAHSMGNAVGNLIDYWEAIESTNFFCGAAIWDWVDQSMYHYDPATGRRYLAYGGDFGDTPNDGQFVMNGIMFGDLEPKPQYYEVKKVYQHIGIEVSDLEKGEFTVMNKYYFKDLSDYDIRWTLSEDGKEKATGLLPPLDLAPRKKAVVRIPYAYGELESGKEHFIRIQFLQRKDEPWAAKGYAVAGEQFLLKGAERPSILETACGSGMKLEENGKDRRLVRGEGFEMEFDMKTGTVHRLVYGGQDLFVPGNGPRLDAFRAFTNNDNWFYQPWFECGLHNLRHEVTGSSVTERKDGCLVLAFTVVSQAPNGARILGGTSSGRNSIEELSDRPFGPDDFKFTTNQIWTVYPDGSLELHAAVTSNRPSLVLPRLGYVMELPEKYGDLTYYGRGPVANYADRKSGQFIGLYRNTVKGEFVNFPKPQEMANHEDVRWCALTDESGQGAVFAADGRMSFSALPYTDLEMTLASHPHKLPSSDGVWLHLDAGVTGLGGNSCGQGGPLIPDRIHASRHDFGFIIRPAGKDLTATASVACAGELPISISRDKAGLLEITSLRKDGTICFSTGKGRAKTYSGKTSFREGGTVTAWFQDASARKTSVTFGKIEGIETVVVYASSEEAGAGSAVHLTDGDPNTIWHTMYSVTVAKYPHWVDLDAGEEKMVKGFTYLPRQNGTNGRVKDYSIQVSADGKNWGKTVHQGTFAADAKEKRVLFSRPVKARFIRFTALSEQHGQDFASGAEITVLAD